MTPPTGQSSLEVHCLSDKSSARVVSDQHLSVYRFGGTVVPFGEYAIEFQQSSRALETSQGTDKSKFSVLLVLSLGTAG